MKKNMIAAVVSVITTIIFGVTAYAQDYEVTLENNAWPEQKVTIGLGEQFQIPTPTVEEGFNVIDSSDIEQALTTETAPEAATPTAIDNVSFSQGSNNDITLSGSSGYSGNYTDFRNANYTISSNGLFKDNSSVPEDVPFNYTTSIQVNYGIQLSNGNHITVKNSSWSNRYYIITVTNGLTPPPKPSPAPEANEEAQIIYVPDEATALQIAEELFQKQYEEQQQSYQTNSTITTADGTALKSTVSGSFAAKSFAGTAITTPAAQIAQNLGVADAEQISVTTWDVTPKSSPLAYNSLATAANDIKGDLGPIVQVNIGKKGYHEALSNTTGTVDMTVGIPASFYDPNATYAMIHVVNGGATEILKDMDDNPATVSFPVSAGNGAYALVKLN